MTTGGAFRYHQLFLASCTPGPLSFDSVENVYLVRILRLHATIPLQTPLSPPLPLALRGQTKGARLRVYQARRRRSLYDTRSPCHARDAIVRIVRPCMNTRRALHDHQPLLISCNPGSPATLRAYLPRNRDSTRPFCLPLSLPPLSPTLAPAKMTAYATPPRVS